MDHSDHENKEVFNISGPRHMMTETGTIEIDWDNEDHRRCVTACLVKGTCVLESDHTKGRTQGGTPAALAPAWWQSFHFRRLELPGYELEFPCEGFSCKVMQRLFGGRGTRFVYGAVFKYAPPGGASRRHPSAPRYIVAFRGTMPRDPTAFPDMRHNLSILLNEHHWQARFCHARQVVRKLLEETRNTNGRGDVWLAGHSLGASIALDVGRHMMTMADGKLKLPTFLFNPPHVSLAPAIGAKAKRDVYAVSYIGKLLLGKVVARAHKDRMEEVFRKLNPWVPHLFVHPEDIICEGFIDYFEQRERIKERLPLLASAASLSWRDMWNSMFDKESERPHLLPSAVVWKNQSSQAHAHKLRQWWQQQGPELVLSSMRCSWP